MQVVRNGESASAIVGINSHFFGTSRVTLATFGVVACVENGGSNECQISVSLKTVSTVYHNYDSRNNFLHQNVLLALLTSQILKQLAEFAIVKIIF